MTSFEYQPFTGSAALSESMQRVLVDFIALGDVSKQCHWNIVGENFRSLHLNLDEVVTIARTGADDVAERMRAVAAVPDGRPATVAATSSLPEAPKGEVLTSDAVVYMVEAIKAVISTMREVYEKVAAEDPASSAIFDDYLGQLEQQAWFIGVENRAPRA